MAHKSQQKRILTGDNPTGKLHLGHYVGSLENRVKLQDEYDTYIIIADMHAFAYPKYLSDPQMINQAVMDVTMDNLAVGLNPKKVKFFPESAIPEIYELATIFSMVVSHNRALRNPTLKEELRVKEMGDNYSLGFVNFPVLQAADIACVQADLVPVGEDQLPHIELTKEIVEKFNQMFGDTLKVPNAMVGRIRRLPGLDGGAKMTKTLGNTIYISEDKESLKQKVMSMYTDPKRVHPTDPGTVEGNPVFIYHDAFNPNKDEVTELKKRYEEGKVGDIEVKQKLFEALDTFLTPIREERHKYESEPDLVRDIISEGVKITRFEAKKTLELAKEKMKFQKFVS